MLSLSLCVVYLLSYINVYLRSALALARWKITCIRIYFIVVVLLDHAFFFQIVVVPFVLGVFIRAEFVFLPPKQIKIKLTLTTQRIEFCYSHPSQLPTDN